MTRVLWRSRWLARLAGCTALAFGLAGTAGAAPAQAQARITATLIQSHVVASWGLNTEGELGDGTTTTRWQYGDVRAGNDVVQVAAGMVHALAVRSGGTVWAWGSNGLGELGDGTQAERSTPVQVTGLTGITQVAAGAFFSLALRSDGTVWAWGDNQNGQLGRGTVTDHEATPARVAVLNGVTKISAGHDFALALRSDGIVFAWGHGQSGQLGNGGTADSSRPVKIAGLSRVTGIAAGWDASLATENDGVSALTSVWAWGGNQYGQLGDGTVTDHRTPERVTGIPASIAGISAGAGFAAVLSIDGSVCLLRSSGTVIDHQDARRTELAQHLATSWTARPWCSYHRDMGNLSASASCVEVRPPGGARIQDQHVLAVQGAGREVRSADSHGVPGVPHGLARPAR